MKHSIWETLERISLHLSNERFEWHFEMNCISQIPLIYFECFWLDVRELYGLYPHWINGHEWLVVCFFRHTHLIIQCVLRLIDKCKKSPVFFSLSTLIPYTVIPSTQNINIALYLQCALVDGLCGFTWRCMKLQIEQKCLASK